MSINLWALSTAVADRVGRGVPVDLVLDDIDTTSVITPGPPTVYEAKPLAVQPNPALGRCVLQFSLAAPAQGSLTLFDASGRKIRTLESGEFARGVHAPRWDGRDDAGRSAPEGIYFAQLAWAPRFRHGGSRSCTDTLENGPSLVSLNAQPLRPRVICSGSFGSALASQRSCHLTLRQSPRPAWKSNPQSPGGCWARHRAQPERS